MSREALSSLTEWLTIVRRRWLIVVAMALLCPALAIVYSLQQEELYQATSKVLVARQSIANQLNGTPTPLGNQDFPRVLKTQAEVAATPQVAERVIQETGVDLTSQELLGRTEIVAQVDTDLLAFRVADPDRRTAMRLSTAFAEQFTEYRRELDTAAIADAREDVGDRIEALRASGSPDNRRLIANLTSKQEELRTMEALQTANAAVVEVPLRAKKVQPRTIRNIAIGVILGLGLGLMLAFVVDALDSRVRTESEIDEALDLTLLGRIPWPSPPRSGRRPMAAIYEPDTVEAEAYRLLRSSFELATLGSDVQTIAVTSALTSEGKSRTATNLAATWARSGKHVIVVDLDLRRPTVARQFELHGPGLSQVLLGHVSLEEALAPVDLHSGEDHDGGAPSTVGSLRVLPSGVLPPNPGEVVDSQGARELIGRLKTMADIVVVDTPPIVNLGDTVTISGYVDRLLVVVRLGYIRRPVLHELGRVIRQAQAPAVGYVVTDVGRAGFGRYGYIDYYSAYASDGQEQAEVPVAR